MYFMLLCPCPESKDTMPYQGWFIWKISSRILILLLATILMIIGQFFLRDRL